MIVLLEPLACAVVPRGGEVVSTLIKTHPTGFHGGWHVILARRLEDRFPGAYTVACSHAGAGETGRLILRVLFAGREWQVEEFPLVPLSALREPFYLDASAPENPEAWGSCRITTPTEGLSDMPVYLTGGNLADQRLPVRLDDSMELPVGDYRLVLGQAFQADIDVCGFTVHAGIETRVEARPPPGLSVVSIYGRTNHGTMIRRGRLVITRAGGEHAYSSNGGWLSRIYLPAGRYRIEIVGRTQPGDGLRWTGTTDVALQPRPDQGVQEIVVDLTPR